MCGGAARNCLLGRAGPYVPPLVDTAASRERAIHGAHLVAEAAWAMELRAENATDVLDSDDELRERARRSAPL